MSTTFSQQILIDRLLQVIIGRQKCNFSGRVQIKTNNNFPPMIYCESVVKMLGM